VWPQKGHWIADMVWLDGIVGPSNGEGIPPLSAGLAAAPVRRDPRFIYAKDATQSGWLPPLYTSHNGRDCLCTLTTVHYWTLRALLIFYGLPVTRRSSPTDTRTITPARTLFKVAGDFHTNQWVFPKLCRSFYGGSRTAGSYTATLCQVNLGARHPLTLKNIFSDGSPHAIRIIRLPRAFQLEVVPSNCVRCFITSPHCRRSNYGLDIRPGSRFSLFREESDRDKSHTGIRPSGMSHQVAFLLPSSTSRQYLTLRKGGPTVRV
jgi:hypothetical protein